MVGSFFRLCYDGRVPNSRKQSIMKAIGARGIIYGVSRRERWAENSAEMPSLHSSSLVYYLVYFLSPLQVRIKIYMIGIHPIFLSLLLASYVVTVVLNHFQ
jgi:hypothetical protein